MKLSLSGFLFEDNYSSQSISFDEFCSLARDAGYDGVELRRTQVNPQTTTSQRRQILHTVRKHGLVVTCITARGLAEQDPDRQSSFESYLELCADLDCHLMKIGGNPSWLHHAAQQAEQYEVTLAINNHVGAPTETIAGTHQYLREVNHPNFGLLYDAMHLSISGEPYLECIDDFYPYTRNILIHSLRPANDDEIPTMEHRGTKWVSALPDERGVQDWPAVFARFKRLGYNGLVTVIESGWAAHKRKQVAYHCAKVLQKFWEEA